MGADSRSRDGSPDGVSPAWGDGGDGEERAGVETLARFLADSFRSHHSVDPRRDPRAWRLIQEAAARAWADLRVRPTAAVVLPCLLSSGGVPLHLDIIVTRDDMRRALLEENS